MDFKRAIALYAKIMLFAGVIGAALIYYQGQLDGRQATALAEQQIRAKAAVDSTQTVYRELESEQQAHRAEYDPQQTVMMSYKVQEAKQAYEEAAAALNSITPAYESAQSKQEHTLLWLVPVIAVMLLHFILAMMFRPVRDELTARAAREKYNRRT